MFKIYVRKCVSLRFISTCNYRLKNANYDTNEYENINTDETDLEYNEISKQYFDTTKDHNCFIIHPYVKWGPQKISDTNPQLQLEEAKSLIRTLAPWKIREAITVPLSGLSKTKLFGSGTLSSLTQRIRRDKEITAVFINMQTLKAVQLEELEKAFRVQIMDRYKIVMQILRLHAMSKHAKLQVALAEIPYLQAKITRLDTNFMSSFNLDTKKVMLLKREQKLKGEIAKLRGQRELLRKKRSENAYPIVAVVGYTNAGKTSLIKALTGDKNLQPKNQLFATLDVTMHAGLLPSTLEILYVDTVGFISDIPTNLIECFVATLEDAMHADVILHVEDVSSENCLFQRRHVHQTLQNLSDKTISENLLNKIITVGNKSDIASPNEYSNLLISSKTGTGIDQLRHILENKILEVTNRIKMKIKVPNGGEEARWLYKNSTVIAATEDETNPQIQLLNVIITKANIEKFKHYFLKKR